MIRPRSSHLPSQTSLRWHPRPSQSNRCQCRLSLLNSINEVATFPSHRRLILSLSSLSLSWHANPSTTADMPKNNNSSSSNGSFGAYSFSFGDISIQSHCMRYASHSGHSLSLFNKRNLCTLNQGNQLNINTCHRFNLSQQRMNRTHRTHRTHCTHRTHRAHYCHPPLRRMSTSPSDSNNFYSNFNSKIASRTLKKVIRPFLRACHPDAMTAQSNSDSPDFMNNRMDIDENMERETKKRHPLSKRAMEVNLKAVQTLNGLIDILEVYIARCTPPSLKSHPHTQGIPSTETSTENTKLRLPELKQQYEIEFILPSNYELSQMNHRSKKRKHNKRVDLSLRSITVEFPKDLREDVRKWALTIFPSSYDEFQKDVRGVSLQEEEAYYTAQQLHHHAMNEFARLLSIAGLDVPWSELQKDVQQWQGQSAEGIGEQGENWWKDSLNSGQQVGKDKSRWTLTDHFLHELGIHPMESAESAAYHGSDGAVGGSGIAGATQRSKAFFGRTTSRPTRPTRPSPKSKEDQVPPPAYAHLHQERLQFMNSINWSAFRHDYDQAFLDAQADFTTAKLNLYNPKTNEGRERRERMVSDICGGVRIWCPKLDGHSGDFNSSDGDGNGSGDGDSDDAGELDSVPEGLDVVQQLIALRRLSMILYDNFDYLRFEELGRMWENLVIVLTPPRNRRRTSPTKRSNHLGKIKPDPQLFPRGRRKKLSVWERKMRRREKLKPLGRGSMRFVALEHEVSKWDKMDEMGGKSEMGEMGETGEMGEMEHGIGDRQEFEQSQPVEPDNAYTESGFKFSYGTSSQVTAYIPIDFGDGELIRQLYTHVFDYFDNVCQDERFLRYEDGELKSTMGGERSMGGLGGLGGVGGVGGRGFDGMGGMDMDFGGGVDQEGSDHDGSADGHDGFDDIGIDVDAVSRRWEKIQEESDEGLGGIGGVGGMDGFNDEDDPNGQSSNDTIRTY